MKKAGIVDPTKVSRSAIQNAVSIASMILTTESLVTDKKEPESCNKSVRLGTFLFLTLLSCWGQTLNKF